MLITVLTEKGGAGKTTLLVAIILMLLYYGKKILLIDRDPQQSLWTWGSKYLGKVGKEYSWGSKYLGKVGKEYFCQWENESLIEEARKSDEYHILIDVAGRDSRVLRSTMAKADKCVIPYLSTQIDVNIYPHMEKIRKEILRIRNDIQILNVANCLPTHAGRSTRRAEMKKHINADAFISRRVLFERFIEGHLKWDDQKAFEEIEFLVKKLSLI